MTPEDMLTVLTAVQATLARSAVAGVVVTHGTDTMEETALFVDLFHDDDRPVVFTGAQRAADQPDPDGPANLGDALAVAAAAESRGLGVLLVFAGGIYAAQGTRKTRTLASAAFDNPESGALGRVDHGRVGMANPVRAAPWARCSALAPDCRGSTSWPLPGRRRGGPDAVVSAGARGLVLEATGVRQRQPGHRGRGR